MERWAWLVQAVLGDACDVTGGSATDGVPALVVRYEALLVDARRQLARMLAFLGMLGLGCWALGLACRAPVLGLGCQASVLL
jgi:hypothetical protein